MDKKNFRINLVEYTSLPVSPYHHQQHHHQQQQQLQQQQQFQQQQSQQQNFTKHVTAPIDKPPTSNPLPPGQNICADCERLIV